MLTGVLLILTTLTGAAAPAAQAAPTPPGQLAVWTPHDLIVGFEHLPKLYSCDDLWYKFRDVLRALGARPDMRILTYQCGKQVGELAYSPQVQLHFYIPQVVGKSEARWADLHVITKTVRLGPGHPASITPSDCELLLQMKDYLLAALPDRVLNFNLACGAPTTRWPFGVSVQTLTPVPGQARVAAATTAPAPKPY